MTSSRRPPSSRRSSSALFAPRPARLALETRILFDGAGAAAGADALGDDPFNDAPAAPQSGDDDGPLFTPFSMPATDNAPVVDISMPGSTNDVLIGDTFQFGLEFKNDGSVAGYGPYIDLYLPKGADGDDGVSVEASGAIKYLGQDVNYQIITLGADGKADHPYARDSSGAPLQLDGEAGQRVVVIELPFGSYTPGQPPAALTVTATLHSYADVDQPLVIEAQSGFRYGQTPTEDYATDPSQVGDAVKLTINPSLVRYTYSFDGPEGETVTGPNFTRTMTTHIEVAPGQTLTDYELTLDVPANAVVTHVNGVALAGGPQQGGQLTIPVGTLSGSSNAVDITYYIPEEFAGGGHVLPPDSGAAGSSLFEVAGSGYWLPSDERDHNTAPGSGGRVEVAHNPAGPELTHPVKSLAVQKSVAVTGDTGATGPSPGDTLTYTLDFQISDYFQFENIVITDVIDDGHTLQGDPFLTLWYQGVGYPVSLAGFYTDVIDPVTHDITRTFRISDAVVEAAGVYGWPASLHTGLLAGGEFGDAGGGGTYGQITYTAVIDNAFESVPPGEGDLEINHGDTLRTTATIAGTVVQAGSVPGGLVTDDAGTQVDITSGSLDLKVIKVNSTDVPESGIKPGDLVTYELTYDLSTGDFENLVLDAYLPKPIFDVTSGAWTMLAPGGDGVVPGEGQWMLVTDGVHDMALDNGSLTAQAGSNGLSFHLGSREDGINDPTKVVIRFTVRVQDDPYADGMFLTAQAQATDNNTPGESTTHQDIIQIRLNEPKIEVKHGIVAKSDGGSLSGSPGAGVTWQGTDGTAGAPFTGTITSVNDVDFDVTGIDAGDTVRFATAIANVGGSGAFDLITTGITVPPGFQFVGGSLGAANLRVYLGDGTALVEGTHYSVDAGTGAITLLDAGGAAGLMGGRDAAPGAEGKHVLIITYDAVALDTVTAAGSYTSTAGVESYAAIEGGKDFLPGAERLSDDASSTILEPAIRIVFQDGSITDDDSSATHTTGANLVIGESMTYDIVVTLPEGVTNDLRIDALIPPGMKLDPSFGSGGYQVITVAGAGGSSALPGDFGGVLGAPNVSTVGGNPQFDFDNVSLAGESGADVGDNNSFVIRVRLIADNVISNQQGTTLTVGSRLTYDKGEAGGADANTVINSTGNPVVTVVEPRLTIEKTVDTQPSVGGTQNTPIDAGDPVQYTITIRNNSAVNAYDLIFSDPFPDVLNVGTWTVTKGGADVSAEFEFDAATNTLRTKADSNLDLAVGESLVITVDATTNAGAASVSSFDSEAVVHWSSLDSSSQAGADRDPNERHGDGGTWNAPGVVNDYSAKDGAVVNVVANYQLSRVGGLEDTVMPADTQADATQAVGEIVRFRLVAQVPEGNIDGLVFRPNLPPGYQYLGNATVAFVSDGVMTSSVIDGPGLSVGDADSSVYGNIGHGLNSSNTADLSGRPGIAIAATESGGNYYFVLGDVSNPDNDPDAEYIVIEFNVVVANITGNQAGTELETSMTVLRGGIGGTELADSNTVRDTVVEPRVSDLQKDVVNMSSGLTDGKRTLTVQNVFEVEAGANTGSAYDVTLEDSFPAGENYALASITIGGTTYASIEAAQTAGVPVTFTTTAGGVTLHFDRLDPGTEVVLQYTVDVPVDAEQAADASTNARLVWSSLPDASGSISETGFAGSGVGTDGSAGGERDGEIRNDAAQDALNDYRGSDPAGYGVISGILWDDTYDRNSAVGGDPALEPRLAGVDVTVTWAGADGVFGTADDVVITATTGADGSFSVGGLVAGNYRIEGPGTIERTYPGSDTDDLSPRWDADAGTALGTIELTLGEGANTANQNIAYLRENDAPSFSGVGGNVSYTEGQNTAGDTGVVGTAVRLTGDVTVNDPELVDQGLDNYAGTTLTVGRSNGAGDGFAPSADDILAIGAVTVGGRAVTVSGSNVLVDGTVVGTFTSAGGQLQVTFNTDATSATVNAVASAITYANSSHTPDASVLIRYRFNDANDSDKQGSGGALTGDATVTIAITAVNDPPVAVDDVNGLTNVQPSVTGNVITGQHTNGGGTALPPGTPDSDPDTPYDPVDSEAGLRISGIEVKTADHGNPDPSQPVGTAEVEIAGKYGTLKLQPNGSYTYELNPDHPDVYGLPVGSTLTETFEYTLSDGDPADSDTQTDKATLAITITGAAPGTPTIVPGDHNGAGSGAGTGGHNSVYEQGLLSDGDTSETVTGDIAVTADSGIASLTVTDKDGNPVVIDLDALKGASSDAPVVIQTPHGQLEIIGFTPKDGEPESAPREGTVQYRYTLGGPVDNSAPADDVAITDTISLTIAGRLAGETANGTLDIQIVDHTPGAVDDTGAVTTYEPVLTGDNVFDNDAIGADGATVTGPVTGFAFGTPGTPPTTGVGDPAGVDGSYGTLVLNADGSYTYTVDTSNPVIQALTGNDTPLTETFTYTITDADGDLATATLTITITGNAPPVAVDDTRSTPEDTPVSGNVLGSGGDGDEPDSDPENDPLTVTHVEVNGTTVPVDPGPLGTTVDIPGAGTLVLREDGSYTFTPVPDWHGTVPPITYTIDDGKGGTDTAILNIVVTPVPDAVDDREHTLIDVPVTIDPLGNDSFEGPNPVVSVEPGDGPSNGTVTVQPDGRIVYTPAPGFTGEDRFTYTVTSGGTTETAEVVIEVTNQPPVPLPDFNTVPEDTPATGNVLGNDHDPDGHPIEVIGFTVEGTNYPPGSTVDIPGVGTITLGKDGDYTFVPVPDWHGEVPPIHYTITDGHPGGEVTTTLTIVVTPVPDAEDDRGSTDPGKPVTLDPLGNDSFKNPDAKVTEVTQPPNGRVTIEPDGRITYTPNPGFSGGTDTFTYTVTSGGRTETATVTIVVAADSWVAPPPTPTSPPPLVHHQIAEIRHPLRGDQVRDPSVFFDGAVPTTMPRMPLPFHPIVYVNRAVQAAQGERETADARSRGDVFWSEPGEVGSSSIGAGLGMDPNLFVQHSVRDTQRQAGFLDRLVLGRLGRIGLSSDRALPTPELFQQNLLRQAAAPAEPSEEQAQAQQAPAGAAQPPAAEAPAAGAPEAGEPAAGEPAAGDPAPGASASLGQGELPAAQLSMASPSFSEQLRGGSGRLPVTLQAPKDVA